MRSALLSSAVVTTLAAVVTSQNVTTSPPFFLKLTSDNETLNGQYLGACHAGAAIEGLCTGAKAPADNNYSQKFYLNQTDYGSGLSPTGTIGWNLPIGGSDTTQYVPSPLNFQIGDIGSNVVVPLFSPGYPINPSLGFDEDSKLYFETFDDSKIVYGQYPNTTDTVKLYHWYACYAATGGYFYDALAWVTSGEPHNPTCQAVSVVREFA